MLNNLTWLQALKSKTIWAIAGMVLVQGLNAASADPQSFIAALHVDPSVAAMISGVLGLIAAYRRAHPVQGVPGKDPTVF